MHHVFRIDTIDTMSNVYTTISKYHDIDIDAIETDSIAQL